MLMNPREEHPKRSPEIEPLTRIERVLLLQGTDLFHFCAAEEIVRIASIADPVTFQQDEIVYRATEPADALYCVVDGSIELTRRDGTKKQVSSGGAFGVLEILSGQLRQNGARAVADTRALVIQADDFFDLLSNNVEIIKALFREVLDENQPHNGGGLA